jgi:3',5'-cyclic-AMP phosphodiesterase
MSRYIIIFTFLAMAAVSFHGRLFASQNDRGFSFIVIGDTRPVFGSSSYENFSRQIERINSFNPSLVLNLGDLIYGYMGPTRPDIWNQYRATVSGLRAPYYQLPGNHDIFSRKAEHIYDSLFHKRYFSFDHKGAHFTCIDNSEQAIWGNISAEQLSWIKTDLAGHTAEPSFVFMHLPMWLPGLEYEGIEGTFSSQLNFATARLR